MNEIKRYNIVNGQIVDNSIPMHREAVTQRLNFYHDEIVKLRADHAAALQSERDIVREIAKEHDAALRQAKINMAEKAIDIFAENATVRSKTFYDIFSAIRAEAAKE